MKKLGLFVLFATFLTANAQTTLERCQSGACYGFGAPTGVAMNGYIYQDLSQTPPALYCGKNATWVACGGSGGGLASFTTGNLSPLFTVSLGANPTTAPVQAFTLSSTSQNFFLAGPTSGAGVPSYRAIVAGDIPTSLPGVSIGGNAATASNSTAVGGVGISGLCQTGGAGCPASGSGLSGQTVNYLPKATSSTNSTAPSIIEDIGTGVIIHGTGTVGGATFPEGTPATPLAANEIVNSNSATHTLDLSSNGAAFSPICTAANGRCGTSVGAAGNAQISNGSGGLVASDGTTLLNGQAIQEYVNTVHPPLAYWDAALHNCQNQVVNVVLHGDSRTIIDTTVETPSLTTVTMTFAGKWGNRLAAQLQSGCGSAGTALVPFRFAAGSGTSLAFNNNFYASTGTWTVDNAIGPYQGGSIPDAMTIKTTSAMTINFTAKQASGASEPFDHLLAYCASGPGLNAWTMTVDGNTVGSCGGSAGSLTAVLATSSAVTLGVHTASLSCATSPCEAYGMGTQAGTTGVSISNLGVGSGAAEMFGLAPSTQYAFSDLIPGGQALDIIYLITNEPGSGYSTGQFQTTLNNMIAHDRALTYPPSVLIISPLQDGITGQTPYYPILLATARAQNTAYFDLRDRWGTGVVSFLFGPDTFHENNIGHGEAYSAVAQTVIDVPSASLTTTTCAAGFSLSSFGPSGGVCSANSIVPAACGVGFAHHAAITLATASGGSDLTNFPILLGFNGATTNSVTLANLKTVANGGQVQLSTGLDIIFCTAATGGTQLSHELVAGSYAPTTGAGEWYVNVPTVSHTAGTSIVAFWGNASAANTSATTAVWANGYVAVYHFGLSGSLALSDSTSNGNTLTNAGATASAGEFGGAASLTSSQIMVDASPVGVPTGTNPRTIEAWVAYPSTPGGVSFGYGNNTTPSTGGEFALFPTGGSIYAWTNIAASMGETYTPNTSFHQYALTLPSSGSTNGDILMYIDGSLQTLTCSTLPCTTTLTTAGGSIQVNGVPNAGGPVTATAETVDEFRISAVGRTAGWEATQYANQSNPSTFLTVGTIF